MTCKSVKKEQMNKKSEVKAYTNISRLRCVGGQTLVASPLLKQAANDAESMFQSNRIARLQHHRFVDDGTNNSSATTITTDGDNHAGNTFRFVPPLRLQFLFHSQKTLLQPLNTPFWHNNPIPILTLVQ